MALARNLNPKRSKLKIPKLPQFKKLNKWAVFGLLFLAVGVLLFGGSLLLPHLFTSKNQKAEVKYETGDRPLTQKVSIWIVADGGLNMREKADSKSKAVSLIPNGTQLTAEESLGDWYRVIYQNKTGWISKQYTTTVAPAESPTKGWQTYQNKGVGYSLMYPEGWVVQDYGANPATGAVSYVGVGPQLAPTLDPSRLPPVVIRTSGKAITEIEAEFAKQSNVITEVTTVSGISGKKYTYNASSGVQMTSYVVTKGATVVIFEETGGYSDELIKIIGTIVLS